MNYCAQLNCAHGKQQGEKIASCERWRRNLAGVTFLMGSPISQVRVQGHYTGNHLFHTAMVRVVRNLAISSPIARHFSVQTVSDKVFGLTLLTAAAVIFVYYTLWVIVTVCSNGIQVRRFTCPHVFHWPLSFQPFIDADHPLQQYFPERYWAIALPSYAFCVVTAAAGTFIGCVMIKSKKRQ